MYNENMKQVRFFPNDLCGLQVREDENGQQSREVNGRAIVFGVRSVNLTPWSVTKKVARKRAKTFITNQAPCFISNKATTFISNQVLTAKIEANDINK